MKRSIAIILAFMAVDLIFAHPGSAQNKGPNSIQKKATNDSAHTKSLPPPVIQPDATPNKQNPGASIALKDIEQPIRIETPVAVNSIKDRWDKALVIFTGLIIAVGLFQIIFLWRTVTATRDNAQAAFSGARAAESNARAVEAQNATLKETLDATMKAADAANTSAYASINSVRPWIGVRCETGNPPSTDIQSSIYFVNYG